MRLKYLGLNHVLLRVSDMPKARAFYIDLLGFQPIQQNDQQFLANVHGSLIGIVAADAQTPTGDTFNPFRIGLDHLALGVPNRKALKVLKAALDGAGVRNNGIERDSVAKTDYISFYDPDGIAWEFYVMSLPVRLILALSRLLGLRIPPQG